MWDSQTNFPKDGKRFRHFLDSNMGSWLMQACVTILMFLTSIIACVILIFFPKYGATGARLVVLWSVAVFGTASYSLIFIRSFATISIPPPKLKSALELEMGALKLFDEFDAIARKDSGGNRTELSSIGENELDVALATQVYLEELERENRRIDTYLDSVGRERREREQGGE
jgi:hypothetical protein